MVPRRPPPRGRASLGHSVRGMDRLSHGWLASLRSSREMQHARIKRVKTLACSILVGALALMGGSCSGGDGENPSLPPSAPLDADLRIEFSRIGTDLRWAWELRCPVRGEGAQVCAELASSRSRMLPGLDQTRCRKPYGAPLVHVSGELGGRAVERGYSPCNGGTAVVQRWQDLRASAGPGRASSFAALRARPVRTPELRPRRCPGPESLALGLPLEIPAEAGLGFGPVHPVSRAIPRLLDFFPPEKGSPLAESRWRANETMWVSESSYQGPVLVRGGSVDGRARLGFGMGTTPAWELRLPAGAWAERRRIWGAEIRPPAGWRVTSALTRIRRNSSAECYFFQVDGADFSETTVVGVQIQP